MIEPVKPIHPATNIHDDHTQHNNACKQKHQNTQNETTSPVSTLTAQERNAVKNNNRKLDIDISKISSCNRTSMDDCEKNCTRYSSCSTIAYANDILVKYEAENLSDNFQNNRQKKCLTQNQQGESL